MSETDKVEKSGGNSRVSTSIGLIALVVSIFSLIQSSQQYSDSRFSNELNFQREQLNHLLNAYYDTRRVVIALSYQGNEVETLQKNKSQSNTNALEDKYEVLPRSLKLLKSYVSWYEASYCSGKMTGVNTEIDKLLEKLKNKYRSGFVSGPLEANEIESNYRDILEKEMGVLDKKMKLYLKKNCE